MPDDSEGSGSAIPNYVLIASVNANVVFAESDGGTLSVAVSGTGASAAVAKLRPDVLVLDLSRFHLLGDSGHRHLVHAGARFSRTPLDGSQMVLTERRLEDGWDRYQSITCSLSRGVASKARGHILCVSITEPPIGAESVLTRSGRRA
jgi:hypothetical protein